MEKATKQAENKPTGERGAKGGKPAEKTPVKSGSGEQKGAVIKEPSKKAVANEGGGSKKAAAAAAESSGKAATSKAKVKKSAPK